MTFFFYMRDKYFYLKKKKTVQKKLNKIFD
jgi:hypothetical protein